MPGFGSNPFGSGPFGRWDWSKQVLWRDLPQIDRQADASHNNRLFKFSESIQPSFEALLLKAQRFGDLRDPGKVRTQFSELISVTPLSASLVDGGRVVEVTLDDPDTDDPFNPLGDTSVGWIFTDVNGEEYIVNSVHKMRDAGPAIEIVGRTLPPTEASLGVGLAGATLRPPGLIRKFGEDFGIEVDTHEPEAFQRSSVRNVTQWLDLKGSAKSYDIIGKIAGYRVEARGLWRLDPVPGGVPSSNLFELPEGSGKFYTDLDPNQYFFDEVRADTMPLDLFCFEAPLWTTDNIFPPLPLLPDSTLVDEAIGLDMIDMPVLSTTDLGSGLWRVRVGPGADMSQAVGGEYWRAEFVGIPGVLMPLESTPVEPAAGEWEFEVVAGTAPAFGATVTVDYQCHRVLRCDYCRASAIRVTVTPEEVLTDPDALLDGVLARLVQKVLQVIPAHVRLTQIDHVVGPVQAFLNLTATAQVQRAIFAQASMGYYFDIVSGDVMPLDPPHLVATGSVVTIP